MGPPNSVIHLMQKVQNAAARLIHRASRHQHCTPLLQQLHWLPISERIKYKTACMCYNSITGSAPSYLSELLQLYSPSRSLRSSSHTRILKLRRFNRTFHGFRSVSYFDSHIWNNRLQDVRNSNSLPSFKNNLKTFLWAFQLSIIVLSPNSLYSDCVCTLVCVCVHVVCACVRVWVCVCVSACVCICI